jgi:hypothetical protein
MKDKYREAIDFAMHNEFFKSRKLNNSRFLNDLRKLDKYFSNCDTNDIFTKWKNHFIYKKAPSCFHSSVFEYIYLTLCTVLYYKEKGENVEINIITTQSPESLNKTTEFEYNPYFSTADALSKYSIKLNELVEDSKGKIIVNRHFLYDIEQRSKRIILIYPMDILKKSFCENKSSTGKCSDCPEERDCKQNRLEFLSQNNTNFYGYPLSSLTLGVPKDASLKYPEIREFIGFKVNNIYEHCYTSNLTDSMTSMFIKLWNKNDTESDFHFIGADYKFHDFTGRIEKNQQDDSHNLRTIWGLTPEKQKGKKTSIV